TPGHDEHRLADNLGRRRRLLGELVGAVDEHRNAVRVDLRRGAVGVLSLIAHPGVSSSIVALTSGHGSNPMMYSRSAIAYMVLSARSSRSPGRLLDVMMSPR